MKKQKRRMQLSSGSTVLILKSKVKRVVSWKCLCLPGRRIKCPLPAATQPLVGGRGKAVVTEVEVQVEEEVVEALPSPRLV